MQTRNGNLRNLLLIDAATCAVMGITLLVAAEQLAALTSVPGALLSGSGLALLPIAAFMAFIGTRTAIPPGGVLVIIGGNAGWVVASAALMAGPWIAPNTFGQVFIGAQALVVLLLMTLEYIGLRYGARTAVA